MLPRIADSSDDSYASGETSGRCGDDLKWNHDPGTKALTITGSGLMHDYEWEDVSRDGNEDAIKSVSLSTGIISIGDYAFYGCESFQSVDLPADVIYI